LLVLVCLLAIATYSLTTWLPVQQLTKNNDSGEVLNG
jgi:hypothetical protein